MTDDKKTVELGASQEVVTAGNILRIIKEAAAAQGMNIAPGSPPGPGMAPGGLKIAVAEKDGMVVVNFGQPVQYMSMAPDQAQKFANTIMANAVQILKSQITPGTTGKPKEVDNIE